MSDAMHGVKRLIRLRDRLVVADPCNVADRFVSRFLGLMGRTHFPRGEGLLFPRCKSVHMWFMRMPIDLVFLKDGSSQDRYVVSRVVAHARPWWPIPYSDFSAAHTLELPHGTIADFKIGEGDELCIG